MTIHRKDLLEKKDSIIAEYQQGSSLSWLAIKHDAAVGTISFLLRKWGIQIRQSFIPASPKIVLNRNTTRDWLNKPHKSIYA
jgi:hypothetical protein